MQCPVSIIVSEGVQHRISQHFDSVGRFPFPFQLSGYKRRTDSERIQIGSGACCFICEGLNTIGLFNGDLFDFISHI